MLKHYSNNTQLIIHLQGENLQQQNEINTLKNELAQIKNILLSNNIN